MTHRTGELRFAVALALCAASASAGAQGGPAILRPTPLTSTVLQPAILRPAVLYGGSASPGVAGAVGAAPGARIGFGGTIGYSTIQGAGAAAQPPGPTILGIPADTLISAPEVSKAAPYASLRAAVLTPEIIRLTPVTLPVLYLGSSPAVAAPPAGLTSRVVAWGGTDSSAAYTAVDYSSAGAASFPAPIAAGLNVANLIRSFASPGLPGLPNPGNISGLGGGISIPGVQRAR